MCVEGRKSMLGATPEMCMSHWQFAYSDLLLCAYNRPTDYHTANGSNTDSTKDPAKKKKTLARSADISAAELMAEIWERHSDVPPWAHYYGGQNKAIRTYAIQCARGLSVWFT